MLVLSRRINEKILIPSIPMAIQVVSVKPGVVRIGIDAPAAVTVLREEVADRQNTRDQNEVISENPRTGNNPQDLIQLVQNRLGVTAHGLAELQILLETGSVAEAELTLKEILDDVRLLQKRLEPELGRIPPRFTPQSCRALLVEDDRNERELLAGFLRTAGVDVATAGDGADALAYLHTQAKPDVVLLDMGLPRVDGMAAVRAIRRNPSLAGLKIFAVTGRMREEFDLDQGPTGVDRWFQKPLDPTMLLRDMNEELGPKLGRR